MDVSATVRRLVDVPRRSVLLMVEAPQQVSGLWADVFDLVGRSGLLLARVDAVIARAERRLDELEVLTDRSAQLVDQAMEVKEFTAVVAREVRDTRALADAQVARLRQLLDVYQPLLQRLAPLGQEASATVEPRHLRGLVALLDELPHLVERLEPALEGMGNMVPQLEGVTDRMDNVGQVVEGLPGAKLLRRRGQAREGSDP